MEQLDSKPVMRQARLHCLDGLRGWGAFAVLLYHVFIDGFPLSPEITAGLRPVFIFNGRLAVWIFFIVSGFSLSIQYCQTRQYDSLIKISLGRHIRLATPIFLVCAIIYLLFAVGAVPPPSDRLPLFRVCWATAPSLWDIVRFSTFDTFFNYVYANALLPPLWTMPYEIWGSALVLGTLFLVGASARRFVVYAVLVVFAYFIHPIYVAFLVGLMYAEVYSSGWFLSQAQRFYRATYLLLIPTVYGTTQLPVDSDKYLTPYLIAASAIAFIGIFNSRFSAMLSCRLSQWMGKISFPLYLIQTPVLYTFSQYLYRLDGAEPGLPIRLALNLATVACCLVLAHWLVPFDRLGVRLAGLFSDYLMGKPIPIPVRANH